ncbi:MAG: hypothetical protein LBU62_06285, partial [Bacteroidales bacterium]|nr:hypothetical protein [Bacteroidales bacterium]
MTRYLPLSEKKGQLAITNRTQLSVTFFKVALLFCFLFITFSAHAQTVTPAGGIVYVKKGGAGNSSGDSWGNACAELATALKAAENNSNIKQIWVAEGTYTPMYKAGNGDTERDKAFVLVKDVKIYGGFAGTETTLEARDLNPLSHPTILNGDLGAADSAYHVVIAAGDLGTALLDGLTITGGKANNDDLPTDPPPMVPRNCGGGIYSASSIEISHVIIRDNRAVRGGGIYNTAYNNTASKLTHVHILRNGIPRQLSSGTSTTPTTPTTPSQGGGIYNANCTATFDSVRIENNVSRQGGGIYNHFGQPKFTKMIISGNKATKSGSNGEGGGIYNYESSPEYTNAVISGNEAATNGGGICNDNAPSKLTNVLLSGNKADNGGGMYHNGASIPVLTNVTIAGNYATSSGGGTYNLANGYNLIIWGNDAGSSDNNAAGAYPNHTSNLVEGVNITGGMDGTNSANDPLFLAPKLATEAPTTAGNYRITLCSPVYNQGDDTRYDNSGIGAGKPNLTAVTTDLDGNPRKAGAHVDLGAYESTAITPAADNKIYVNKNVSQHTPPDYDGSSWVNATPVLADALLFAAKNAGIDYEIWVAEGTYTPRYSATDCRPNGRNNTFVLPPNVKLYGGFTGTETARGLNPLSHPTILSGDLGAIGNAYHVMVIDGAGSAVLDGFIITGGKADGSGDASNGGGLYIAGGSGVTPTIEHVIVSGNEASDGGGMYIAAGTAPKIVSTLVSGNKASGGGGGIYHDGASAVLTNLTISGNNATNGSGIYATGGTLTVYNSIVWGNGSGTNNVYGSPTYHYSLVQGTDLSGSNSNLDGTGDTNNPKFMDPVAAASAPATGGNYRLNVCGSPVSDKGYTGAPNLGSTDLDGMARKSSGGSIIALGAYEKLPSSTTVTGTTLYVNKNVSGGTGDGSSWDNAFRELSDALRIAAGTTVNEIWVAQGTYYPLYSAVSASASVASCDNGNRDNAFVMLPDVKIYGGFTGSEISLAARNWEAHPTILSGDIGISGDPADNAYHVVIGSGITNAAVLDGFTITGGNANGSGSITVQGQTVSQNQGGGVMLHTASPAIAHVKISGNQATDGAGASLDAASPNISNTLISGNKATASGGGMYANTTSVPTLLNVTISGNNAANGSGIFNNGGTAPTVKNCIIWGNTANNVNFDNTTITYSLVEGISVNNSKHILPGTTDPQFIAAVDAGQAPTV